MKLFIILFPLNHIFLSIERGSFSERWLFLSGPRSHSLPPDLDTLTIIIRFWFWSPSVYVIWTSLILLETQVSWSKIFNMNRKVKLSKKKKKTCRENQMDNPGWVQLYPFPVVSVSLWLSKLILMFASDLKKTMLDMCNFSTFNFSMVPLPAFLFGNVFDLFPIFFSWRTFVGLRITFLTYSKPSVWVYFHFRPS